MLTCQLINAKYYAQYFGIHYNTALKWLKLDLETYNISRMTLHSFNKIYNNV